MHLRSLAAALAGSVVLGCSPADGDSPPSASASRQAQDTAQDTARDPGGQSAAPGAGQDAQVTGAVGIPWGTPYDTIVARRGPPAWERREAEEVMTMAYEERVLGREMAALFFVHPRHGLMRGGYVAPVDGPADCAVAMRLLDNVVTRRYPALEHEVRGATGTVDEVCASALSGQAGYAKGWTDPVNGARILLVLLPRDTDLLLTYTTREADAWERRKNDARF